RLRGGRPRCADGARLRAAPAGRERTARDVARRATRALPRRARLWRPVMPDTQEVRANYRHFDVLETRWNDNDVYGHVNNVAYYAFFDTVINRYLINEGGLDIARGAAIGVAVETACTFVRAVAFPDVLEAGLRVAKIGTTSVRYEIGI